MAGLEIEQIRRHNDYRFRAPMDLEVTPLSPRRVLVIGACFAEGMAAGTATFSTTQFDYVLFTNAGELPDAPPRPMGEYDFQWVILPLSSFLPSAPFFCSPEKFDFSELFAETCGMLARAVEGAQKWSKSKGILTFFSNFVVPAQNPLGRLVPRYTYDNPAFFIEELNRELDRLVRLFPNCFVIDTDGVGKKKKKKSFHDENLWRLNHGQYLTDWDYELDCGRRIEEISPASAHYQMDTYQFQKAVWHEVVASFRTISGTDAVKLVVIDLDDTLWRGVAAEGGLPSDAFGGWPEAFAEALLFLKRRGVLLAIISKNYEAFVRGAMPGIVRDEIKMEDFCAAKINWNSKTENMAELLAEVNLLPKNVLYIDDNPVERDSISSAFPGVRTLGSNPYYIKRILLGAPETQVSLITSESSNRTEMIQAQVIREQVRKEMSREDFLASLNISLNIYSIDAQDSRFGRAFELLNKTNQFNTTGRRWSYDEISSFLVDGKLFCFEVKDKYTSYGLVGVVLFSEGEIVQFVMSCRVIGLDVELTVASEISSWAVLQGYSELRARFIETPSNKLCADLYHRSGFHLIGHIWLNDLSTPSAGFPHISVSRTTGTLQSA